MAINFTGTYLTSIPVLKKQNSEFQPQSVSLIEIDKNDNNDMNALEETELLWGERRTCTFLRDMIQTAEVPEKEENVENEHYLVLTKQNNNFDKLNPNDILGTALFYEKNGEISNEIKWFQVKPKENHTNKYGREYKSVGSSMLDYFKSTYAKKPIYVYSSANAIDFYKKHGFENCKKNYKNHLAWISPNSEIQEIII